MEKCDEMRKKLVKRWYRSQNATKSGDFEADPQQSVITSFNSLERVTTSHSFLYSASKEHVQAFSDVVVMEID